MDTLRRLTARLMFHLRDPLTNEMMEEVARIRAELDGYGRR